MMVFLHPDGRRGRVAADVSHTIIAVIYLGVIYGMTALGIWYFHGWIH